MTYPSPCSTGMMVLAPMSAADVAWAIQVQPEILQSVDVEDIESALRGCLLKLQYANASLGPCKEGALYCNDVSMSNQKNA